MKVSTVLLLIIAFLFIGISMNIPSSNDLRIITQEKLNDFEDNIINKDNEYESEIIEVNPNVVNSAGKKVEGIIDKGFGYVFKIIKGVINDK